MISIIVYSFIFGFSSLQCVLHSPPHNILVSYSPCGHESNKFVFVILLLKVRFVEVQH